MLALAVASCYLFFEVQTHVSYLGVSYIDNQIFLIQSLHSSTNDDAHWNNEIFDGCFMLFVFSSCYCCSVEHIVN